jgi:hypothetical protein
MNPPISALRSRRITDQPAQLRFGYHPSSSATRRTRLIRKPNWGTAPGDTDVSGFGIRVTPRGQLVYVIKYRISGQQRWYTIGRHGSPWTPEMARKEAQRLLGEIARGVDPSEQRNADRKAISFRELCDFYLAEGIAHKKPATIKSDVGRIIHHL